MTRDLTFEERDYADWLLRIEASAIQPLKWIMLAVCLTMWLWAARWTLPPLHVFTLFFLYMMLALVGACFLRARRIPPAQVKPFVIVSYAVDLLFVTLLILFDITRQWSAGERQSEYYLLYFLVVLRGFAIFRSPRAHLVMSVLISILFVASVALQEHTVRFLAERAFLLRFALIWLVILLAWFIIEILHQQQRETMRVRERLLRSENLARLGEVAAGVAHELNNPLGVISAYSEFLLRAAPPEASLAFERRWYLLEAQRLDELIRANRADPLHGTAPLQALASLDPRRHGYRDQLARLLTKYADAHMYDNLLVAWALAAPQVEERARLLEQIIARYPDGDALPEAMFWLADLEIQSLRSEGAAPRVRGIARMRALAGRHAHTIWGRRATQRLKMIEPAGAIPASTEILTP